MQTIDAVDADRTSRLETAPRFTPEPQKISLENARLLVTWLKRRPEVPAELTNAAWAWCWIGEVDNFRTREEQCIVNGKYDVGLPAHRAWLSDLIATGEAIILDVKNSGMATDVGFTVEDVQATLDSLHTTFRCEHGPRNSQKTNELITQLFDGSES